MPRKVRRHHPPSLDLPSSSSASWSSSSSSGESSAASPSVYFFRPVSFIFSRSSESARSSMPSRRERQGRLFAYGEKNYGSPLAGHPQVKIQKAFASTMPMYSLERSEKSTGTVIQLVDRPCRIFTRRPYQVLKHPVHVAVGQDFIVKAGTFKNGEGLCNAVGQKAASPGAKSSPPCGDGKLFVMGTLMDEAQKSQNSGQALQERARRFPPRASIFSRVSRSPVSP